MATRGASAFGGSAFAGSVGGSAVAGTATTGASASAFGAAPTPAASAFGGSGLAGACSVVGAAAGGTAAAMTPPVDTATGEADGTGQPGFPTHTMTTGGGVDVQLAIPSHVTRPIMLVIPARIGDSLLDVVRVRSRFDERVHASGQIAQAQVVALTIGVHSLDMTRSRALSALLTGLLLLGSSPLLARLPDTTEHATGGPTSARVIVWIAETGPHSKKRPVFSGEIAALETQLAGELRVAGFIVLDAAVESFPRTRDASNLATDAGLRRAASVAAVLGADYVIVGEATSTGPSPRPKAKVERTARLQLVAVRVATGESVARDLEAATTLQASAPLASDVALATAGRRLTNRFVATLADRCRSSLEAPAAIDRHVAPIEIALAFPGRTYSWTEIQVFRRQALDLIGEVADVTAGYGTGDSATLAVTFEGSAEQLAERLAQKVAARKYHVKQIDSRHIVVEVRD